MRKPIAIAVALLGLAAPAAASVPHQFTVEGLLRDSTGALQTTSVNMTVQLFDAQTAGNQLGETFGPTTVMATNGLFSETLNLTATDLTAVAGASQVWLQVVAGNDTYPRQLVTAQMFALFASTADVANSLSSTATVPGSQITGAVATATSANGLQSTPVAATAPTAGQTLIYNGTQYTPGAVVTSVATGAGLTGGPITGSGTISIATGGVTNAMLASSSLTVGPGHGLSGGGTVALGGSTTLSLSTPVAVGDLPSLAGDVTGAINASSVSSLQGATLTASGANAPSAGQVLKYSGTAWTPAADANSGGTVTQVSGSGNINVANGSTTPVVSLTGTIPLANLPPVMGDVTGTVGTTMLASIQGVPVSTSGLVDGEVLRYSSSGNKWQPSATASGTVTSVSGSTNISVTNGTTTPVISLTGTIPIGDLPSLGGDVTGAINAASVIKIGGAAVTNAPSAAGQFLRSGAANSWSAGAIQAGDVTLAGDVTGNNGASVVSKLQTIPIMAMTPADAAVLKYNQAMNQWQPSPDSNSGGTVTSITAGSGLTGGTITNSGTLAIGLGLVSNAMLTNSGVTVSPGHGLTGGGAVALGGAISLALATPIAAADLPSLSGSYVDLSTNQSVAGNKTFSGLTTINNQLVVNDASPGGIVVAGSGATESIVLSNTAASGRAWGLFSGSGGAFGIFDSLAAATRLFIDTAGNVGIGTNAPGTILDVVAPSASGTTFLARFSGNPTAAGGNNFPVLALNNSFGPTNMKTVIQFQSGLIPRWEMGMDPSGNGSQQFYIYDDVAGLHRIDINASGQVGIGTSTPAALLAVVDTQPASSATNGTNAGQVLQVSGAKGGNTTGATGQNGGIGGSVVITAGNGGNAVAGSTAGQGGSVTINAGLSGTGGTNGGNGTVLIATSGGNVGLGTVTPSTKAHVVGGGNPTLTFGTGEMQLGGDANGNINMSIGWSDIQVRQSTGSITAATATTLNLQPLGGDVNIHGGGNFIVNGGGSQVGIGLGSPSANANLDVNGGIRVGSSPTYGTSVNQGGYIGWNHHNTGGTVQSGEMDFVDQQGSGGGGGFLFSTIDAAGAITDLFAIYSSGHAELKGTLTSPGTPSDISFKTHIRTIDNAMAAVDRLRGVRFDWKKDGKPSIGVIAQEVERVFPEIVSTLADGTKAVQYDKLVGPLIEAVKEQQREIDGLRGRVAETERMRRENGELRARLDRLEDVVQKLAVAYPGRSRSKLASK